MGVEAEEEIPCWSTCCVAHDIPVSFKPLSGKKKREEKKRREKKKKKNMEYGPLRICIKITAIDRQVV